MTSWLDDPAETPVLVNLLFLVNLLCCQRLMLKRTSFAQNVQLF
jgi:hypothetical protein